MFAAIEKYRLSAQILLGAVGLSFVGFGFVGLDSLSSKHYISKVGDVEITSYDINQAMRGRENADRESVYQSLLLQAYLLEGAKKMGIVISDDQIKQEIVDSIDFHNAENRFDPQLFQNFLQANGLSEQSFMDLRRRELTLAAMLSLINTGISTDAQVAAFSNIHIAPRLVRRFSIDPSLFTVPAADETVLQQFFTNHQARYVLPQAIQFEYLRLKPQDLADKQTVSEEELSQALQAGLVASPQRNIAHIMIEVAANADDSVRQAAKEQAEKIAQQAKANPESFANLAAEYSQDSGTKHNGGVLGQFSQNGELKNLGGEAFEAAAFALQEGEVSHVVESPAGYHILQASGIEKQDTPERRREIENAIRTQKAQQAFAATRDSMAELALNHPDELNTAANQLGIALEKHHAWLSREEASTQYPAQVVEALFGDEVFERRHVSEVIVVNGEAWLLRAVETRNETQQDFAQVKAQVTQDFVQTERLRLANETAQKLLSQLNHGENPTLQWSAADTVLPAQLRSILTPEAFNAFMQTMPKNGKSAYVALEIEGNLELIEVQKIEDLSSDGALSNQVRQFISAAKSDALLGAYLEKLRQEIPVKHGIQNIKED